MFQPPFSPQPPSVWGPRVWDALHYISLGYPENPTEEDKQSYRTFYELLGNVLPCHICANHFKENYKTMPLTDDIMSSKNKVIKWVIDLHNIVNVMKHKHPIPYEEALQLIQRREDSKCTHLIIQKETVKEVESNNFSIFTILITIFGALVFIAFIYKKK
jgi:hypothetical protein